MGYIKKESIDSLMDRIDIEQLIGSFVKLKRSGANMTGLSPWVSEKSPSFVVSPVKNIFKDFASGRGGNAVTFIMELNACSYPEAIETIAKHYNYALEYEQTEQSQYKLEQNAKKELLRPVLKATAAKYREALKELPLDHPAQLEIAKRGYSNDTIIEWGIGYAPENFLYDLLKESGRVSEGESLGLIIYQKDKYSNRLVYPINDSNGLIIGLAGRNLLLDVEGERKKAKWINPDVNDKNLLYNKSKVWFGLDKARTEIRKRQEAWIVEGYNDVIGWHINGLPNTVSPCGTAITKQQIFEIKKLCKKVVFCMDPDRAGIAAMIKHIQEFIKEGFTTEVVMLDSDPDDYTRAHQETIAAAENGLETIFKVDGTRINGFRFLMEQLLKGDEVQRLPSVKNLCGMIALIEDKALADIYIAWLSKESKIKLPTLKKILADVDVPAIAEVNTAIDYSYEIELPKDVKEPLAKLEKDIRTYGMFMANDQVYMSIDNKTDNKLYFHSVSNFMIEVLQHMSDEKFPTKLLRIKNVHGLEKIFDTPSENLNSPQLFENAVTGHGNFFFNGDRKMLQKLKIYLFDKMGHGRKIDVLGWQPDGNFWAWNNKITTYSGSSIEMDDNGIFVKDGVHYYLPSANSIYKSNSFKFDAQKRFRVIKNSVSFETFAQLAREVHRDHAISGILFGIASLFQDIVVAKMDSFPILFLYGPGSTGKDELAKIVQSFVGIPQTAINLEAGISTAKASIREFAQFRNGISQLSEYKGGYPQIDGMIKSLWDRRGYKRGNIETHVGTDSIPIEASAILTGNDYPREEPVILRTIWNEMDKSTFSEDEMKTFDKLKDIVAEGLSGYSDDFMVSRAEFEIDFDKMQRKWKGVLKERWPMAAGRIVGNISVLTTTYEIFANKVNFGFTQTEMLAHFSRGIEQQTMKINSGSILNRFWTLFIASLRGNKEDRIQVNQIVNVEGELLYFNWTHCFTKIQRMWFGQFGEAAPNGATLQESLDKSGCLVEKKKSYSYDTGREANRTSAFVINLKSLGEVVAQDIVGSIMFQQQQTIDMTGQTNAFGWQPPATPDKKIIGSDIEEPF